LDVDEVDDLVDRLFIGANAETLLVLVIADIIMPMATVFDWMDNFIFI